MTNDDDEEADDEDDDEHRKQFKLQSNADWTQKNKGQAGSG